MNKLNLVIEYFNQGGAVNYGLLVLFLVIAYVVGFRLAILYRGRKIDVRALCNGQIDGKGSVQADYWQKLKKLRLEDQNQLNGQLEWHLIDTFQLIHRYSFVLNTAVLLAPLLGLLGTVIGMIETFSSLADADLFSSSGGIAGGISQALITTQFGLVVAIPGVFLSRYLKKIETKTYMDTIQMQDLYLEEKRVHP